MGLVMITKFALECDGQREGADCKAVFGTPNGFASEMDARVAAAAQGWGFPTLAPKEEGGRPRTQTSIACPSCLPGWTQLPKQRRPRHASDAEMREGA